MASKNILFFLFIIFGFQGSYSQVVLSSQPLDLKKSSGHHAAMIAADAANKQLVAFASDKENVTALLYNSVLFFTDSLVTNRPDSKYEFIAGYSFEGDRNTHLYWASEDYKEIFALGFNFDFKSVTSSVMSIPFKDEDIVNTFSDNNSFYIITLPDGKENENKLKFYVFNGGKFETKLVDFSAVSFFNTANKNLTLNNLLGEYRLPKIETKAFTGLPEAARKIKFYITGRAMVITLDHNPTATQLLTIDLDNFTVSNKAIPQVKFEAEAEANSYLHNDKLYQFKLNSEQLSLSATDLKSGEVLKTYSVTSADSITFVNSLLLSQTGNQRPKEFKNTKKFLQKAAASAVAVSAYRTPDDILITMGGVRMVLTTGEVLLGAAVIAAGGSDDGFFDPQNTQLVYFESLFDENFEHINFELGRLAVDYLSEFMSSAKNVSLESVMPFDGYLVLGYYDSKEKQYILRKFRDDDF